MFKVGIYSRQQNLIVILLAAILAVQLWPKATVTPEAITHPVGTLVSPALYTDNEVEEITNPYSDLKYKERQCPEIKDYQLELQDNGTKITMYDHGKPVFVFDRRDHPNCELFKRIDMDNE